MTEAGVERFLQRALEKFPTARPRVISDNGPQFIARDFKESIRLAGLTYVRTSPYHVVSAWERERLIHRDVKPENILISGAGVVKVSDLGSAKRVNSGAPVLTRAGITMGSPQYVAPNKPVARRCHAATGRRCTMLRLVNIRFRPPPIVCREVSLIPTCNGVLADYAKSNFVAIIFTEFRKQRK